MEKNVNEYGENININNINGYDAYLSENKEFSSYNLCRISKNNDVLKIHKKSHLIGVIDVSGSMYSYKESLIKSYNELITSYDLDNVSTIVFESNARILPNKILNDHDFGGGTNIFNAVSLALQEIKELVNKKVNDNYTILFVSDGNDSWAKTKLENMELFTLENILIRVISIGIGAHFPTFIAMSLREKVHNDSYDIPAVYMTYNQEELDSNLKEIFSNNLDSLYKFSLSEKVMLFPYSKELINEVSEKTWFLSTSKIEVLGLSQNEYHLTNLSPFELDKKDLISIFSGFHQNLNLRSLNKKDMTIKQDSSIILDYMSYLYEIYKSQFLKTDSHNDSSHKKLTVLERLRNKEKLSGIHVLEEFISNVRNIKLGDSLLNIGEAEAAKRLAIGTQQGKFHSAAIKMKGLDNDRYEKFKAQFIALLESDKIKTNESSQEVSFILLSNMKEILQETSLIEAIQKATPYELVECFPLVGKTLKVNRTNASMINPFLIHVESIPKLNSTCDTVSLVTQGNEMMISIGNSEEEQFNAILPLFTDCQEDLELKSYMRSGISHLLMTFNCMRNIDTFYHEAYFALLSNTFITLMTSHDSAWKYSLLDKIYYTTELVYKDTSYLEEYLKWMIKDIKKAVVTEYSEYNVKCEDISKTVLGLYVLIRRNTVDSDLINHIFESIVIEGISRLLDKGSDSNFELTFDNKYQDIDYSFLEYHKEIKNEYHKNNEDPDSNNNDENNENNYNKDQKHVESKSKISDQLETSTTLKNKECLCSDTMNIITVSNSKESQIQSDVKINNNNNNDDIKEVIEEDDITSIDYIKKQFIKKKKHLHYDSIRNLKKHLKSEYEEIKKQIAINKNKNKRKAYLKIITERYNKPNARINLSLFFKLSRFFTKKPFNNDLLLISYNHHSMCNSSKTRANTTVNSNIEDIIENTIERMQKTEENNTDNKLYNEFESFIIEAYLEDYEKSKKLIKDSHLNYDLLKNKAVYDKEYEHVKVMFLGPESNGKSSLIGRLMLDSGAVDEELWKYYIKAYNTLLNSNKNDDIYSINVRKPYSWLSDLFVDDRVNFRSSYASQSTINIGNKRISIFDTPGKVKYYTKITKRFRLVDHIFLVIESNYREFKNNIEYISFLISLQLINNTKTIHVVFTKIDSNVSYDKEISKCIADLKDLLDKTINNKDYVLKIFAVSAYQNININDYNEIDKEIKNTELCNNNSKNENKSTYPNLINYLQQLSKRLQVSNTKSEIEIINKPVFKNEIEGKIIVHSINNKFNIIKGLVTQGTIKLNSKFSCNPDIKIQRTVQSIQINYQNVDQAEEGDYVSIKVSDTTKSDSIPKSNQILHFSNIGCLYSKGVVTKKLILVYQNSSNKRIKRLSNMVITHLYGNIATQIIKIHSIKDKKEIDIIDFNEIVEIECEVISHLNNTIDILDNYNDNDVVYIVKNAQCIMGQGKIKSIVYE